MAVRVLCVCALLVTLSSQGQSSPVINSQPQSQTIATNGTTILTVDASGTAPINYQWYIGTTPLSDSARMIGTQTAALTITNATSAEGGSYSVLLTNAFGNATSWVATVTVVSLPVINIVSNPAVAVGGNVNLGAYIFSAASVTNQWFFNGVPVVTNEKFVVNEYPLVSGGGIDSALTVLNAQFSDAGNYWLVASNLAGGTTSSYSTLVVGYPPEITQHPQPQTVTNGYTVVFNVAATGSDPLSYKWNYNSSPLSDDARHFGTTTASLTISNTLSADSGSYSVDVANAISKSFSSNAQLTVLVPPSVTKQPLSRSVPQGLPTTFSSTGNGSAPLSFQWRLNDVAISGATASDLKLTSVSLTNLGTYTLVLSNSAGTVTSSAAALTFGPVAPWGDNIYNQGLPPAGLTNVIAIGAGGNSDYALLADGSLSHWGVSTNITPNVSNLVAMSIAYTETGIGLRSDGVAVGINRTLSGAPWTNVVAVAAAPSYVYALRYDGTVLGSDQLVPANLDNVTAISASGTQVMALRNDGTVVTWAVTAGAPTTPPSPLTNVTAIASGYNFCLAVKSDGHIVAWGNNLSTNIPASATNVVAVTASQASGSSPLAAALRADGTIVTWGSTGIVVPTNAIAPSKISNAVAVAVGTGNGVALVNNGLPLLVQPPVGGVAYSGRNFTLRGLAIGAAPLSYQWFHDGASIARATNSALVLANVSATDAGSYQLVVTNALGSATSIAAPVQVNDSAPFVLQAPVSQTFYVGATGSLGRPINGSGPMTVQWRYHPIASIGIYTNIPGATNEYLVFNPVNVGNAGSYSVIASNAFGVYTSPLLSLTVRQVVAWGISTYGNTNVPTSLTNATAVCGGNYYNSFALRDDGSVLVWGLSASGGVVQSGFSNIVEVICAYSGGSSPVLGLRMDGTVASAGLNVSESNIVAKLSGIVAVESDGGGRTFLKPDGTILRLYSGGTTNFLSVSNVVSLSQWDDGFQALRADGTIFGSGTGGAPPFATNVVSIASSRYAGSVLKRDQTIIDYSHSYGPPSTNNFLAIASTATATELGVGVDGSVHVWGGFGDTTTNIPGGLPKLRVIDGGYGEFLALCTLPDFQPLFLHTALNTSNLVVSSRNSPQWYAQSNVCHDGFSAARSASIGRNTASSMRTLITNGPVAVSFWWKVSSETNHDFLTFSIGGVAQSSISGEVDWQHVVFNVPAGPQMLTWTYSKDTSGTAGLDAGFVDQFAIGAQPPTIYAQPQSQTVLGGSTVNFSVGVDGQSPFTNRWYRNNDPIGKDTNVLTFANIHRSFSGTFKVVVANALGSVTSSDAVLTVHTPQEISVPLLQPDGTLLMASRDTDNLYLSSQTSLAGFQAQYSSNMVDWLPVTAALSVSNGYIQFNDTDATNDPMRFYRVIEAW
ncbi:MAG: immunoglobulin domain-containing protein [Limisphaerales bacterium]